MRFLMAATVVSFMAAGVASGQDKLAEIQRQESRGHFDRGEALMTEESFDKAAAEFRLATRLDPEFSLAFFRLGQASMALHRYEDAAGAFETCRTTLQDRSLLVSRASGEARQQRIDDLLDVEAAIHRWGEAAPPTMITMRLQERKRQLEQQQERQATAKVEIPPELSIALGSAYFRLGRLEDAEREYATAIGDGDRTGAAHNNIAVIFMMTGRLDEATAALRQAEAAGFLVNPRFREDLKDRVASSRQ